MRWLIVLVTCACSTEQTLDPCPEPGFGGSGIPDTPCTNPGQRCFVVDTFESCASAWYVCERGQFRFERGLDAVHGHSCADSPLDSCTFEGNDDCVTSPGASRFSCVDGAWQQRCGCYGGFDCDLVCPVDTQSIDSDACALDGQLCDYADRSCHCVVPAGEQTGHFECTP